MVARGGIIADRHQETSFWGHESILCVDWIGHKGVYQTILLKWVYFMYINSSSIKLIYEGEKVGHKHLKCLTLTFNIKLKFMLKELAKASQEPSA